MSSNGTPDSILIVRLGAMGDIVHTLPAVSWLKRSFPRAALSWLVESKWTELLRDNPYVDEILTLDRRNWREAIACCRHLRQRRFDLAVDFQGLFKSALPAAFANAVSLIGFDQTRERLAAWFYGHRVKTSAAHVVDRNLELAAAAGARRGAIESPVPRGKPEGSLPQRGFVLASPLAGWSSKQWPLENFAALGKLVEEKLGLPLVLNGAPSAAAALQRVAHTQPHLSSIPGLLDATHRASAVIGLDSGPLHLAAAINKPGVAIFGPTDPARNGPYGSSFAVLRSPRAATTYKRGGHVDASMRDITPQQVFDALQERLGA